MTFGEDSMPVRTVVVASVEDAPAFEEKFDDAPVAVAKDFDLMKSPTETTVEFFVMAAEGEAIEQFREAANFVGQKFTVLGTSDATQ